MLEPNRTQMKKNQTQPQTSELREVPGVHICKTRTVLVSNDNEN